MRRLARVAERASLSPVFVAAITTAALGCHAGSRDHDVASDGGPTASASASTAPVAHAPTPSSSARLLPRTPPGCRAASVRGTPRLVSIKGAPTDANAPTIVAESSDVPDDFWVDLDSGAKLTARHPRSTRETTFTGPGRVRPCVVGGEEAWVVTGTFESVLSSGERPGVEQWVVTPVGVVRYGSARVEIDVTPETATSGAKAEVKVTSGTAYAWTGDQAGALKPPFVLPPNAPHFPDGWTRIEGPRMMTLSEKRVKPEDAAASAIARCKVESTASRDLATAVAGPDASLAQLAPKHVVARHLARAACDVALLRVGLLPPSTDRDALYASLKTAESDWKTARPPRRR